MAQRFSGFDRVPNDLYQTPPEQVAALPEVVRIAGPMLEPACGQGNVVRVFREIGIEAYGTDIVDYGSEFQIGVGDFLAMESAAGYRSIVTNPPYGKQGKLAEQFVRHALRLMERERGQVFMLLSADFDCGITRRDIFADCPAFSYRVPILERIRWFADSSGNPSTNHAWFGWDFMSPVPPIVRYPNQFPRQRKR